MMEKCKNCPVTCNKPCVAQLVNATDLCDKVNPDHPSFKEAYKVIIDDKACGTQNYKPTAIASQSKDQVKPQSFWQAAKGFGKTVSNYVRSGFKHVDEEEYNKRFNTCQQCEHFDKAKEQCGICHCMMRFKCKLAAARCPLNPPKWDVSTGVSEEEIKKAEEFKTPPPIVVDQARKCCS